uniref:Uncharacterized protein n=1 Tax=Hyaloperonospora arabidopsidis (strain Emoy2) TaxID=559515 RepID=M4BWW0_HYAAE
MRFASFKSWSRGASLPSNPIDHNQCPASPVCDPEQASYERLECLDRSATACTRSTS